MNQTTCILAGVVIGALLVFGGWQSFLFGAAIGWLIASIQGRTK